MALTSRRERRANKNIMIVIYIDFIFYDMVSISRLYILRVTFVFE